jgi:outer membrane receptor protein involved in Fe transport
LENAQQVTDASAPQLAEIVNPLSNPVYYMPLDVDYANQFEVYTAELNQILQRENHTDVFGARVQDGTFNASALLDNPPATLASLFPSPQTSTSDGHFQRFSAYEYHHWEILDGLMLIGGLAYDFERYPANYRRPPLTNTQTDKSQWSPKAALIWNPVPNLTFRGVFSRALGGVSYDESVRLEPTQLAGFDQDFRSIISESLIGSVEAPQYQIAGGAVTWKIYPKTWLTLQGQAMSEQVSEDFGYFLVNFAPPARSYPGSTVSDYDYHETDYYLTLNQIVARDWFFQAQYQYAMSDLKTTLPSIPATPTFVRTANLRGDLGQLRLSATWQHPNGLFVRGEVDWFDQTLGGSAPLPSGQSFVQANLFAGYRFPHRHLDLTVGVLNLVGNDYHLSPINYYLELPHQRLFYTGVRFSF